MRVGVFLSAIACSRFPIACFCDRFGSGLPGWQLAVVIWWCWRVGGAGLGVLGIGSWARRLRSEGC